MAHIAKAIAKGDGDALRKALGQESLKNAPLKNGHTGLSLAILSEDIEMVAIFLETSGVDVNLPNSEGLTPLMAAISSEASTLLAKHSKIDLAARDLDGQYAVHHAARSESQWAIKFLGDVPRAQLDVRSKNMLTPLHLAVEHENTEAVSVLLERKSDVNAQDLEGNTSLVKAIRKSSTAIAIRLLQSSADPKILSKDGNTALHYACMHGCSDMLVQKLTESGLRMDMANLEGETPQQLMDEREERKRMEADLRQERKQNAYEEKAMRKRTKQQEAVANSPLTALLDENGLVHLAERLTSKRYLCVDDLRDLTFEKLKKAKIGNTEERNRLLGLVAKEDERRAQLEREREERELAEALALEHKQKWSKVLLCVYAVGFVAVLWILLELVINMKKR